jgi:hypothetical protein
MAARVVWRSEADKSERSLKLRINPLEQQYVGIHIGWHSRMNG